MKVILIGFMGAGKSTLAKLLAKNQNIEYIDIDKLIIEESGRKSDSEIFDKDGEAVFRKLETKVSKSLEDKNNVVISTGGGIIMNELNIKYLKTNGVIIFLKNTFETSQNRVNAKNSPPLFRDKNKAKELYQFRLPLYTKYADIVVETDKKSLNEIADEIITKINI